MGAIDKTNIIREKKSKTNKKIMVEVKKSAEDPKLSYIYITELNKIISSNLLRQMKKNEGSGDAEG